MQASGAGFAGLFEEAIDHAPQYGAPHPKARCMKAYSLHPNNLGITRQQADAIPPVFILVSQTLTVVSFSLARNLEG
jgi:hypothetical protein